jgi:hypothetical protein
MLLSTIGRKKIVNDLGPNVRDLFIRRMSILAVPDGGGFADGMSFFFDKEKRAKIMKEAEEWTKQAIELVRSAAEPNPWKDSSDEEIAGEILRRLEERNK